MHDETAAKENVVGQRITAAETAIRQADEKANKAVSELIRTIQLVLSLNRDRIAGIAMLAVSKRGRVIMNPDDGGVGRFFSLSTCDSNDTEAMLLQVAKRLSDELLKSIRG